MKQLEKILIAIDQLFNAILGGWPDETLSSRAWRWHTRRARSWPMGLINALFIDPEHCLSSYLSERRGRQLPPELRPEV
ncbi:MAG: pseudouridine synthase [Candidatus Accumulibacter sp.]|jgi:hypothetical protein|nr:pseudouridine synthase [Accumulibacter sp.]